MDLELFRTLSLLFMALLFTWSLIWIIVSLLKIKKSDIKVFWQTNLLWNSVNILIAVVSLLQIFTTDTYELDRANDLLNIVAINIILDILYVAVAVLLLRSKNITKQLIGKAVFIQGLFLLIFDIVIILVLKPLT